MSSGASARAYANIALTKYWGKLPGSDKGPATPSISLALDQLATETHIERCQPGQEQVELDDAPASEAVRRRLLDYLTLWRSEGLLEGSVSIRSRNHFPTGAGLASSASGFAALAAALAQLATRPVEQAELSRLARRGSGSAARSVVGGLARLPAGPDPSAEPIAAPEELSFGMVVATVEGRAKEIGSTRGMEMSRESSPYYQAWLNTAAEDDRALLQAWQSRDLERIGDLAEANALAMHACMIATRPGLLYWRPATLELIDLARRLRAAGTGCWATIDAGPHVCLIAERGELQSIAQAARGLPGVVNAEPGLPAPAAGPID